MCDDNNTAKNRCLTTISDKCVSYTGPDVPALGVVKTCGDLRLSDIEAIIIKKLTDIATGAGIELSDITGNCDFVNTTLVNADKSLATLIQLLFDNDCTLNDYIKAVDAKIEPPFSFDLGCLATVAPPNPSRNQIIQAIIQQECINTAAIAQITNELATDDTESTIMNAVRDVIGNMVTSMFTSCQNNLIKTGSGATSQIQVIGDCPIGTMLFGKFDRSSFDDSGLGLASKGMCGWAFCNGNNGTEDTRGFTLASTIDTQGPALNPLVSPGSDSELAQAYLSRKGKNKAPLNSSQLPDHNHTVTDPGHTHSVNEGIIHQNSPDFGNGGAGLDTWFGAINTGSSTTGITVGGLTGASGQPIDFRQPTLYVRVIQRIS